MIKKCGNVFILQGKEISYLMAVDEAGHLYHLHFGRKLKEREYQLHKYSKRGWSAQDINHNNSEVPVNDVGWSPKNERGTSLDEVSQEYPSYGRLDLRLPAFQVEYKDGNCISECVYADYEIISGKPEIPGMPSVRAEDGTAETLRIVLKDGLTNLEINLFYTVFAESNIVCRRAVVSNYSEAVCLLRQAFSANLDLLPGGEEYDLISFPGAWGRERQVSRQRVKAGIIEISNRRGGSGHQNNPFTILCGKNTNEEYGETFGSMLMYSGNHSTRVEMDQYGMIRFQTGIAPETFQWKLESGESFYTPECILAYSDHGLQGLSHIYHEVLQQKVISPNWRNRTRPVLLNSWEAVYFQFNEEKLLKMADEAQRMGIELFVLDDGWFGRRNNDRCSLGDWTVNREKLPGGLEGLAEKIHKKGLKFGIWMEPEMISEDSDLFRKHPDWIVHVEKRKPAITRNQYVLDLARKEVRDYIYTCVSHILEGGYIDYVKWDMNRHLTDVPNMEYSHRYILGFYELMERIIKTYPDILFENCAGGGGRFDAGLLYYMPQVWTSDDSDALERMKIQYGTSFGYPPCTMGAHVSAVPNHQTGRVSSLCSRINTAYMGLFGFELDLEKQKDNLPEIKKAVDIYKKIRSIIFNGKYYRLRSPFETNQCAWEMVDKNRKEFCVFIGQKNYEPNPGLTVLKLRGLEENLKYKNQATGEIYGGDELMYYGLKAEFSAEDSSTLFWYFVAEEQNT